MEVKFGQACPAYDFGEERDLCRRCDGCERLYSDSVECLYSKIPTCTPKYKVGEKVYGTMIGYDFVCSGIIRKVEWDGRFQWVYYMQKCRTPHKEKNLFSSDKEAEIHLLQRQAKKLLDSVSRIAERFQLDKNDVTKMIAAGLDKNLLTF